MFNSVHMQVPILYITNSPCYEPSREISSTFVQNVQICSHVSCGQYPLHVLYPSEKLIFSVELPQLHMHRHTHSQKYEVDSALKAREILQFNFDAVYIHPQTQWSMPRRNFRMPCQILVSATDLDQTPFYPYKAIQTPIF